MASGASICLGAFRIRSFEHDRIHETNGSAGLGRGLLWRITLRTQRAGAGGGLLETGITWDESGALPTREGIRSRESFLARISTSRQDISQAEKWLEEAYRRAIEDGAKAILLDVEMARLRMESGDLSALWNGGIITRSRLMIRYPFISYSSISFSLGC